MVRTSDLSRATAVEELLNFKNHDYHERFIGYYSYINSSQTYYDEIIKLHNDINKMQILHLEPKFASLHQ